MCFSSSQPTMESAQPIPPLPTAKWQDSATTQKPLLFCLRIFHETSSLAEGPDNASSGFCQKIILHIYIQGCSAPIVVKIADSPKDKERKKLQSQMAQQLNQITSQWKNLAGIAALAPVRQAGWLYYCFLFSLRHFGQFLLRHYGHFSHSRIKTLRNSVH